MELVEKEAPPDNKVMTEEPHTKAELILNQDQAVELDNKFLMEDKIVVEINPDIDQTT